MMTDRSDGCYGFQWTNLQKDGDRYACKLFRQSKELCFDSDDQIEVYIAGDHVIPTCTGKTFKSVVSIWLNGIKFSYHKWY